MSIMDDMQRMMMMQQMQQQGQPQGMQPQMQRPATSGIEQGIPIQGMSQRNPIADGSMAAMNSTKQSLEMGENENKRALGRALLAMMSSVDQNPAYGTGFAGNLSALSSGIAPALLEYDNERNRIAQLNYGLLANQKEEEKEARKEARELKKMSFEMDIANKKLGIERGYLGLKNQEREDEIKQHEMMSQAGAKIPLSTLGKNQWTNAQNEIKSYLHVGDSARNTLQSIQGAKKILTDNPKITKNMSVIMLAAQRHDPSIIKQKLNSWLISDQDRKDSEMLSKYLSNLYTSKLPGFSAKGMNMFLEKRLADGSVDITMAPEAALELLSNDEEVAAHHYKNGQDVYEEYEKGNFYRPAPIKFKKLEEESETNLEPKKSAPKNKYVGLSPAELDAREAELRGNGALK
jgi:hypothetical protein